MRWVIAAILVLVGSESAKAQTYFYPAVCEDSYSKQGEAEVDLTKQAGKTIRCDGVVLGFLRNGNILIQFMEKASRLTPLGFAGSGFDYEISPVMGTLPLQRVYLPHMNDPSKPQIVSGVEGYCFVDGKFNPKSLTGVACTAKIDIGTQRLVYRVNAKMKGQGQTVPGG